MNMFFASKADTEQLLYQNLLAQAQPLEQLCE
jgi:hypothetical protein